MRTLTDERLSLADLERQLAPTDLFPGMNRSALQRYDANEDLKSLLGKDGQFYPASSLRWWRLIAEARAMKPPRVEPATAALFLLPIMQREAEGEGVPYETILPAAPAPKASANGEASTAIALTGDLLGAQGEALLGRIVAEAARAVAREALGPPEDRLLTIAEAHELTGLAKTTIRSLPAVQERPGGRKKWKRSVLLDYIRGL